jgi:hypothetical protein
MPEGLRRPVDAGGPGKVFIGIDLPSVWNSTPVDHIIISIPGLSNHDRIAILGATPLRCAHCARRINDALG